MLTVCTWLWGEKYSIDYVHKLAAGVRRHLKQPHKFVCFVDAKQPGPATEGINFRLIVDRDLSMVRGCFARLRMFDQVWQSMHMAGDRLVCLDLDMVVTGPLDPLFDRPEPFVILQGANAVNPCPYNGSVMMLQAGAHPDVWSDFSIEAAGKIPFHEYPDDQGWIAHKVPGAAGWKAGAESGVYGFQKPGWPKGSDELPAGARLVAFFGRRDPSQFTHLDWVKANWV